MAKRVKGWWLHVCGMLAAIFGGIFSVNRTAVAALTEIEDPLHDAIIPITPTSIDNCEQYYQQTEDGSYLVIKELPGIMSSLVPGLNTTTTTYKDKPYFCYDAALPYSAKDKLIEMNGGKTNEDVNALFSCDDIARKIIRNGVVGVACRRTSISKSDFSEAAYVHQGGAPGPVDAIKDYSAAYTTLQGFRIIGCQNSSYELKNAQRGEYVDLYSVGTDVTCGPAELPPEINWQSCPKPDDGASSHRDVYDADNPNDYYYCHIDPRIAFTDKSGTFEYTCGCWPDGTFNCS